MHLPERLPPESLTIELAKPITVKGGALASLKLREPTAQEMSKAEAHLQRGSTPEGVTNFLRSLVGSMTGLTDDALDQIPISKLRQAAEYFNGFSEAALEPADIGLSPEDDLPETWDLELPKPLDVDGLEYTSLPLCEPSTGAQRKAQGQFRQGIGAQTMRLYQIHLVVNATGVPMKVVQRLPVSVLNTAVQYLSGFSDRGRVTSTN